MRNALCAILIGLVAGPAFADEREEEHEDLARMILERLERLEMRMKRLEQRRAPDVRRVTPARRERRESPKARYDLNGLERLMVAARSNEDAREQLMRVRAAIDNALRLPGRKGKEMKREREEQNRREYEKRVKIQRDREREMKARDARRHAEEMRNRAAKLDAVQKGLDQKRAQAHERLAKMQQMVAELERELARLRAEAAGGRRDPRR